MHSQFLGPLDPSRPPMHGYAPGRVIVPPGQGFPMGPQRTPNGLPSYDNTRDQAFGPRIAIPWRGQYDPRRVRYQTMQFVTNTVAAAGTRIVGLGNVAGNGYMGVTIPTGYVAKIWEVFADVRTGATVGSNYDCEAGVQEANSVTYPVVLTLLNQSNDSSAGITSVAVDDITPLASVAAGGRIIPFIGMIAGSTGGTNNYYYSVVQVVFSMEPV